jgi:hypothetical protein
MRNSLRTLLAILVLALLPSPASAQAPSDDWKVVIYPLLGWLPVYGADFPSVPSGPGDGGAVPGGKIESELNGALLFGGVVAKGPWRAEVDGMWAALRGERPVPPLLDVDLDLIYGHVSAGRRVYKNLHVTGGVRRLAAGYTLKLADFPEVSRKPGLWDPLIGVAWHHERRKYEIHATFEGGGFGVGADKDLFAGAKVDWMPIPHFRLTVGYGWINLKITDTVLGQTFTAQQTLQGPIAGLGFSF